MLKKTKIVCTIGPSSLSTSLLEEMHQAGMDGSRINTAYGDLDQYKMVVNNVRDVADIPIIVDIKGPEIRLRARRRKVVKKGEVVEVGFGHEEISFNHRFYDKMCVGDYVYIDNGKVKTRVVE
ncbi:MAG TPA: hypothetical protein ENF56_01935, partial [Candidatus Bathyarchaeota archaeon]|nr:hypothetical protein [Candidatus Bathyarchaeota archaeon]